MDVILNPYLEKLSPGPAGEIILRDTWRPDPLASSTPQFGMINHALHELPLGQYSVRQRVRTMQEHELLWRVPEITHFSLAGDNQPRLIVLHPCCPDELVHLLDPQVPTIQKGMSKGRVAFLTADGQPILRVEPFREPESVETRVWLELMDEEPRHIHWALFAALILAEQHAPLDEGMSQYRHTLTR